MHFPTPKFIHMGQQPEILLCLRIFNDASAVKICAVLRAGDYVDNHTQKHQTKNKKFPAEISQVAKVPTEPF